MIAGPRSCATARGRLAATLVLLTAAIAACGGDGIQAVARRLNAAEFGQPYPMPSGTLTDQRGNPFDLRAGTAGKITFVYFGYTHCPDVCPLTMAALARGLQQLDPSERAGVETVFITLDAARDDPARLDRWLSAMDTSFVGLTGEQEHLEEVLGQMGFVMPPYEAPEGGDYEVPHPATLFLFTPEPQGRFGYPAGSVTPEAVAADVRELEKVEW